MLLPEARMVEPLPAFRPAALFAIVERSMLTVDRKALMALPALPEMIDSVMLAYESPPISDTPSDVEPVMTTFFSEATLKPPKLFSDTPNPLSLITLSATYKNVVELAREYMATPPLPPLRKLRIVLFSTWTSWACKILIPTVPLPCPSISRPRKVTTSVVAALIVMPELLKPTGSRTPAVPASHEMVTEKVMVTMLMPKSPGVALPKSPGSRQLISPPGSVFASAPAKVLQGEVRLQGFISSAVVMPETHVRVDPACAGEAARNGNASAVRVSKSPTL